MNKPKDITQNDWNLLNKKYGKKINKVVKKINKGYPIQYLIGNVNFFGYEINVNKKVFIPRPETELLVERTLKMISELDINNNSVIDICSGSGCIAITLSKELNKKIDALEISKKSIKIASKNATINVADINFKNRDIMKLKELNYDIIVSNPPYVKNNSKVDIQTKYEPQRALYPKKDELEFYKHILNIVKKNVKLIAFEIASHQSSAIIQIVKKELPNHFYKVEKDYTNKNRFIFIWK